MEANLSNKKKVLVNAVMDELNVIGFMEKMGWTEKDGEE